MELSLMESLCPFSGFLLFSLLSMLFNKPEIILTTTTISCHIILHWKEQQYRRPIHIDLPKKREKARF